MNDISVTAVQPAGQSRLVWADSAGMIASIACAIHCAAMPMVIAYLPALGMSWLADEEFHQWMAAICFGLAALAFLPGWRKHRSLVPFVFGGIGVLLLSVAAYGLEEGCCPGCAEMQEQQIQELMCDDPNCTACIKQTQVELEEPSPSTMAEWVTSFVTPLGGVLLVIGHIVNHRRSCSCQGNSCCLLTAESESTE